MGTQQRTLWQAIDKHRASVQVLGAMVGLALFVSVSILCQTTLLASRGRLDVFLYSMGGLVLYCAFIVLRAARERKGYDVARLMGAQDLTHGMNVSAENALLDAAIATGHSTPPGLARSASSLVNAVILGKPGQADWVVIATDGFFDLTAAEQTVAYINLIERKSHRLFSWALANRVLLIASMIVGFTGLLGPLPIVSKPVPATSPASAAMSILLSLGLLFFGIAVSVYVHSRILVLSDENALLRAKSPESALSGLLKARFRGFMVPGCENKYDFLFWLPPNGVDASMVLRIQMLERVTGAAGHGVKARVEELNGATDPTLVPMFRPANLVLLIMVSVLIMGLTAPLLWAAYDLASSGSHYWAVLGVGGFLVGGLGVSLLWVWRRRRVAAWKAVAADQRIERNTQDRLT